MTHARTQVIDGHTFVPHLVPPGSWALDAGCRGFALSAFLAARGVRVLALDADPDVRDPHIAGVTFLNAALVAEREMRAADGRVTLYRFHDCPEAHTTRWGPPGTGVRVPARTLAGLMRDHAIRKFALVKLDIEGSEYGVMEEMAAADPPLARQVSVEYHDFCHMSPTPDDPERWHAANLARLSRRYQIVRHVKQPAPWGPELQSYMDCLYVAKPEGSTARRPSRAGDHEANARGSRVTARGTFRRDGRCLRREPPGRAADLERGYPSSQNASLTPPGPLPPAWPFR